MRAYTARSEITPVKIGIFTNKWMNWAVLFSFVLIILVVYVPFLNPVFNHRPLTWVEWRLFCATVHPSVAAEFGKSINNRRMRRKQAAGAVTQNLCN